MQQARRSWGARRAWRVRELLTKCSRAAYLPSIAASLQAPGPWSTWEAARDMTPDNPQASERQGASHPRAPVEVYCVALTTGTLGRAKELKSWGFAWNPLTNSWNRIVRNKGAGINLARFCEGNGYGVLYHVARPEEIDPRPPKVAESKLDRFQIQDPTPLPQGNARSYFNPDTGNRSAGDANGWNRKRTSRR